jgi:fluoroquinolone transport system permease protein
MNKNIIVSQIQNDFKSMIRDPFLRYLSLVPLVILIGFITLKETLINSLAEVNVNYYEYSDLIISFLFLTLAPSLFGSIAGFILLDYKDENIFDALALTPIGNGNLLIIKLVIPYLISVLITGMSLALLEPSISLVILFFIVLLSGLNAPFYALILSVIAKNKIQGMSVQKVSGILMIIPIINYFSESDYSFVFGIDPLYWIFKAYWLIKIDNNLSLLYCLIGIVYYCLVIKILLKKLS